MRPLFVPVDPGRRAADLPGVGHPALLPASKRGDGGVSQSSRGTLVIIRPVLRPRRDQAGSMGPGVSCLTRPPRLTTARAHREEISGLNRTAFDRAVSASQGGLPTRHARLASGCWPGSTGRDWLPAGFLQTVSSRAFLLFRASWRKVRLCFLFLAPLAPIPLN